MIISEDIKLVGERLTDLRNKNNMTQEEFAEYMCVTRQSVSKWETDKTYPDVEKLIKIAELYNVTLDYLIRGEESVSYVESDNVAQSNESELNTDIPSVDGNTGEYEDIAMEMKGIQKISTSKKNIGIITCLFIAGIFALVSIAVIIMFLIQNPWFHSDIVEQSVKVDGVYSQLSMAQVSYENQDGDKISELVLLDTANIRQGDYINLYANDDNNLYIDYGTGILVTVIIFFLLNVIVIIILLKELIRK